MRRRNVIVVLALFWQSTVCNLHSAMAQNPPLAPIQGPPNLLYVRLDGPPGMQATFYQGLPTGHTHATPCAVGLRPGYRYRIRLSGLPGRPQVNLFPTLEVCGCLQMPHGVRIADYPAPVTFTDEELDKALSGSMITKVILLENPCRAAPVATLPREPLEYIAPGNRDPWLVAQQYGRPVLIVRLGQREVSREELAAESVPGTILLPGEKVLPAPRDLPGCRWSCVPLYDSILGPRFPVEQYLCDGGDHGLRAGHNAEGQLVGLDPADTVAEYADSCGRLHIAVSNCVCIYVPRFAVVRSEIVPLENVALVSPGDTRLVQAQNVLLAQVPSKVALQVEQPVAVEGGLKVSSNVTNTGPLVIGRPEGTLEYVSTTVTEKVTAACEHKPCLLEKPLKLIKFPDKCAAHLGEIVTFTLRYSNHGQLPIRDIIVSDSLTGRLEYVTGSARSDRDAVFTTQPNEAGSLILRWQINGPLPPGESGQVTFQTRVR
jgi:uncharacterized repeat protein (TIGR01451 family)